ncbi:MAG: hypothetical protein NT126_02430 [Bacteroidetes bacterium]|nr:hypothetical protein [Bacteroidota bacterium]
MTVSHAQEELNSSVVEKKSFELFSAGKWDELVSFSKEAIGKGYDYFYLRYRYGYALYSLQRYRQATMQFQHASHFNSTDSLNRVMLYYSYSQSERFTDATLIEAVATGKQVSSPLDFLYAETGEKISDTPDSIGNMFFFHFGLQSRFSRRISLYGGYSYSSQDFFRDTISQNQLLLKGEIKLARGISFVPVFSLLSVTLTTAIPRPPPPMMPPGAKPPPPIPVINTTSNYVTGANARVSFGILDVKAGGYVLRFDGKNNLQFPVSVNAYPFGNDRLVCFSEMNMLHDSLKTNSFFKEGIRVRAMKDFWISAEYMKSNLANFLESEGYSIDNSQNILNGRLQVSGIVHVNHWNLYLTYQHEKRTTFHFNQSYSLNNFFLGLKFSF